MSAHLCTHTHTDTETQTQTHQLPYAIKNQEDLLYFTHPQGVNNSLELRQLREMTWWEMGCVAEGCSPEDISMSLCPEVMRTIHDFISSIS